MDLRLLCQAEQLVKQWQTTDAGGEFLSIDWEKKNPSDN